MADVVFLEYRFNPEVDRYDLLAQRLVNMGFTHRSKHAVSNVEVWVQARAILMVKPDYTFASEGQIMGLGSVATNHPMDNVNGVYLDADTDFYAYKCDNGFKFYFTDTDKLTHLYKTTNNPTNTSSGINAFGGLVISTTSKDMLLLLNRIAEKVETSEKYTKFIFKNKFTIFVKDTHNNGVELIVSETIDVFGTTSFVTARGIRTVKFIAEDLSLFGDLAHKIAGYNCKAFGNEHSYSIENYIPKENFNVDLVFRSRKKYIKIKEDTLAYYDSIETK